MFSEHGHIICEDRNTESKSATFFCFDTQTNSMLWKDKIFEEKWWIGLSAVTNERLYLHGFRKPDMPEQKNIIAVDLFSGNTLWQNTECTFLAIQAPFVFGYKDLFERRVYYKIDERNGAIIEELNTLPDGIIANTQYEKTDFTFPQQVAHNDDGIEQFMSSQSEFTSAEYISRGNFVVLNVYSRHTTAELGLKNTLSIIDTTTKKKVYSDVLNESTQYPVPDSFFMDRDRVFYIKERKTFVALDLP